MKRLFLLLCLLLAVAPASATDLNLTLMGVSGGVSGGGGFTGLGDIVSGAKPFYSVRAYSAAVAATGTQKAFNLQRVTDGISCDVLIATSGDLGLTTATCNSSTQGGLTPAAFAGTDATGAGSITGTTLTFTGGHIGDMVTGGTTAVGTYIISGASPTWTVNLSQTVASATLTLTVGLGVATWYDQSGNALDVVQAVAASQPIFVPVGLNGKPSVAFNNAGSVKKLISSTGLTQAQPLTEGFVMNRTGNTGAYAMVFGTSIGGNNPRSGSSNSANTLISYAGTIALIVGSIADLAWHSVQAEFLNGATSYMYVDGVASTPANPGTNSYSSNVAIGWDNSIPFTGFVSEVYMYPAAVSSGNNSTICHNQFVYFGTSISC